MEQYQQQIQPNNNYPNNSVSDYQYIQNNIIDNPNTKKNPSTQSTLQVPFEQQNLASQSSQAPYAPQAFQQQPAYAPQAPQPSQAYAPQAPQPSQAYAPQAFQQQQAYAPQAFQQQQAQTPHTQAQAQYQNPNNTQYRMQTDNTPTGNYQNIANAQTNIKNTKNSTKQLSKPSSNEKFIIVALLTSVIITSIIIALGWTLFMPKSISDIALNKPITNQQDTITTPEVTSSIIDKTLNPANSNEGLEIIYNNTKTNPVAGTPKPAVKQVASNIATTPTAVPIASQLPQKTSSTENIVPKATQKTLSNNTISNAPVEKISNKPQYWIQVFSTTNRDKALTIQQELIDKGINPTITTKNITETMYYRLRIGPYYNKAEGNKFLVWVKQDNKYKDAYISLTSGS